MSSFHTPGEWDKGPEQFYDNPMPPVFFAKRRFCLTGIFAYADRKHIEKEIEERGGAVVRKPSQYGCYVVVGTLPAKDWITADAGRKLFEAIELRDQHDCLVFIISEDHFVQALLNTPPEPRQYGDSFAQPLPPITFEQQLAYWFDPIMQEFPSVAIETRDWEHYMDIHLAGDHKQRLCRIYYNGDVAVFRGERTYIGAKRHLPDALRQSLRDRMAELAALAEEKRNAPPPREKQPHLTPEELKRRNTARKAAMRAKPVTQEVLAAARAIINALAAKLPPGCVLEGADRAKYYSIDLLPKRQWICRLHYKTKNKYIELPSEDMIRVNDFEQLDNFIASMATALEKAQDGAEK